MQPNLSKVLTGLGFIIVLFSALAPYSEPGRALFDGLRRWPHPRMLLLTVGAVLISVGFWNRIHALVLRQSKRTQEVALAALILAASVTLLYRDVVFYDRTFLVENTTAGTLPWGPSRYPEPNLGAAVFDVGAIGWQIEPFSRFISRSLKEGDFPLWNPYAGPAGNPLLADGHTAPLEPLHFLSFLVPNRWWPLAIDFQLLARYFIAAFGCYLFSRRQKLSLAGASAVAIVFVFSAYFVGFGNHPQVRTQLLLPLVLYGYDRLADRQDRSGFWWCALLGGWAILAGMPEAIFFTFLLGSLWYFYASTTSLDGPPSLRDVANAALRFLGSTSLSFLIAAPFLFPMLEYVAISAHYHWPGNGGILTLPPIWAYPAILFQIRTPHYIGILPLFSLFYGLANITSWVAYRRPTLFFALYAIVLLSIVYNVPMFHWLLRLPIFNQINVYGYAFPSILFCVAMLAGTCVSAAARYPLQLGRVALSLAILTLLFLLLPILAAPAHSVLPYFGSADQQGPMSWFVIGTAACLVVIALLVQIGRLNAMVWQIAFLGLLALAALLGQAGIHRPMRYDPFRPPKFVRYLQGNSGTSRIMGLDGFLYPNISTAYELSDIRWLNGLVPRRAFEFSTEFVAPDDVMRFTGTKFPISDRMFDLLDVKFVLMKAASDRGLYTCTTPSGGSDAVQLSAYFENSALHDMILLQNPQNEQLQERPLEIGGSARAAVFAQAPQEFDLNLRLPPTPTDLTFAIGLDPAVFPQLRGDGVDFAVSLSDGNERVELFRRYIDPKHDPCDRKWFDVSIDLQSWAGKEVVFTFSTKGGPAGDTSGDWAYWGDVQFKPPLQGEGSRSPGTAHAYRPVYQDDMVQIYENEHALGRAFVVYSVVNVPTSTTALERMADPDLDLSQTAVVENLPPELEDLLNQNGRNMPSVQGTAALVSSGELHVAVTTEAPGLLVISDQYYPGWQAFVDGKPVSIYAVDGSFRGVFVDAGAHAVRFVYRPLSFLLGCIVSLVSILSLFILGIFNARGPRRSQ